MNKKILKNVLFVIVLMLIGINQVYAYTYRISENGKKVIKQHESCILTAYWDSNGYSIGWGHHGKDVKKNMRITKAKAEQLFNKDIKLVEASANRLIDSLPYKYRFSQNFFDGLCDLVYNCGEYGVKNSEFWNKMTNCRVRKGKMNKSDLEFSLSYIKRCNISAKGHISRRKNVYNLIRL